MQTYDIIMLIVLAAALAFGAWKGLAWQVASFVSMFASYFVAAQFPENPDMTLDDLLNVDATGTSQQTPAKLGSRMPERQSGP